MHAGDQYLLVIGSVEDANPPTFRQITGGAPEKIVFQFGSTGMFEAEHLTALGVDAGHHVLDGAVFSRRIHRLKDQQDCMPIGRVEKLLLRTKLPNVFFQKLIVLLFRLVHGIDLRRPFFEIDVVSFPYAKDVGINFHFHTPDGAGSMPCVPTLVEPPLAASKIRYASNFTRSLT